MVYIILLGAPGAGKGTQADLLQEWLSLAHISSGDLFRSAIEAGTPLGQVAKSYIDQGKLVPDEVTIGMVAERLAQPDTAEGVILDGFPRTAAQAKALDQLLSDMGRQVDVVPYVRVSTAELVKRLAGRWTCRRCGAVYHEIYNPEQVKGICDVCGGELYQRQDDTPETQRRRIEVYFEQTSPLIEYYREKGLLAEIDGEQSIKAVQADLRRAIEAAIQGHAG
jgi:adenylate kinase